MKRAHRQKNFHEIFYIIIRINIDIEKVVNAKREKKTSFTTTVFEILKKKKDTIDNDLNANDVVNFI